MHTITNLSKDGENFEKYQEGSNARKRSSASLRADFSFKNKQVEKQWGDKVKVPA